MITYHLKGTAIVHVHAEGIAHWFLNGRLHRMDGPAITAGRIGERWYKNGKLHRDNGPAITYNNGNQRWYKNGVHVI